MTCLAFPKELKELYNQIFLEFQIHKYRYQKPTENGNQNNRNDIHDEARICHLFQFYVYT